MLFFYILFVILTNYLRMGSACTNKAMPSEQKTEEGANNSISCAKENKKPKYGYGGSNHAMLIKSGHRHHHSSNYLKRRH